MSEQEIRKLCLFFFYAFLDEKVAEAAATDACRLAQEKRAKNREIDSEVLIVQCTHQIWEKRQAKLFAGKPVVFSGTDWIVPLSLELGPWREFQKNATADEIVSLVWSKVLNISEEKIAEALAISSGTIRYRLGRALRKLGGMSATPSRRRLVGIEK